MLNKVYGNLDLLTAALDGSSMKHNAISNNLSNVNTPGFKKTTINFESELRSIMEDKVSKLNLNKTNKNHMGKERSSLQNFQPDMKINKDISTRRDKNNVNPDIEMIELAKNTIMYNALADRISGKFTKLQSVISEGGK